MDEDGWDENEKDEYGNPQYCNPAGKKDGIDIPAEFHKPHPCFLGGRQPRCEPRIPHPSTTTITLIYYPSSPLPSSPSLLPAPLTRLISLSRLGVCLRQPPERFGIQHYFSIPVPSLHPHTGVGAAGRRTVGGESILSGNDAAIMPRHGVGR